MAYIGQAPINGFHAKQQLTGDGSTVTFTLDQTVATETGIIVSVGGVLQEPSTAYNLTIGGTKITFTEAPSSTDRVYIQYLAKAIVQNVNDINGSEFVLDEDGDTSFTADTDDEIDIRVGGSDINTIKSTGFHNLDSIKYVAGTGDDLEIYHDGTNSLIANKTGTLKIATETSGVPITIGHSTSELTIADNATVTGNLTVTGTLTQTGTQTFDGGIDVDNFNINGTTIALSSGDMLLDSAGDIILDADGADVIFKDAGTAILTLTNSSSDAVITSGVQDKDIIFKGDDGGSAITALTLDMSAAGAATFNDKITAVGTSVFTNLDISGDVDVDGTLETDALTINGTTLAETISDTVGAMVSSNTESGITVAYQDADNTLDFTVGTLNQDTTGTAAIATTVTVTDNESTNENNVLVFVAGADADGGNVGLESDGNLTYNPSTGTLTATNLVVSGTQTITNSVTMNASNAVVFEGSTADAHETTLTVVDPTADRTITMPNQSGTIPVLAAASNTAITTTPAEINLIDGGTSRGTDAVASGDGILINDAGTMKMTNVDTVSTYFSSHNVGGGNIVTTGALNSGSITSGFGTIDTGSSTITTTGLISGGSLDIDNVLINGTTIGHTDDTDLMTVADGLLTVAGEVSMTTLDIGGTNVTATATELNYVDGVTSAVQTQMDTKSTKGFAIAAAIVFG